MSGGHQSRSSEVEKFHSRDREKGTRLSSLVNILNPKYTTFHHDLKILITVIGGCPLPLKAIGFARSQASHWPWLGAPDAGRLPLFLQYSHQLLHKAIVSVILAGWLLRKPVTASRFSGHQSRNKPIFFARSRLVLKPLTVFAITESLSSIFHLDTTR